MRGSGCLGAVRAPPDDGGATAARHVDVDEHDVGMPLADHLDGRVDVGGFAYHVGLVTELGTDSAAEEVMIVDEEDAWARRRHPCSRCIESSTSVP